ncbi:P-selectin isoform X2 [Choloepus didactylus]|uniref:P-selectin isoform X2 n=1 Tax=Choloepus didactylus TaxID=27675 RepID=UPI00189F344E|nr:P-selectin isoform X2 [Choloepus didactylus]
MAICLKVSWNWRFQIAVFRATQLLCFSAVISELMNQKVAAWTYHYSANSYSWNVSRMFCQRFYTDLVAIQNKKEIAHLNDVIPRYHSYYWIGIRKINNVWTWVGTKKNLTKEAENWADNEPNNKQNNQDCVEIYIKGTLEPGKWNDEPCGKKKRALCYTVSCQEMSCSKQGECIETIGNYTCSCHPGFYGPECEYAIQCPPLKTPEQGSMNCLHSAEEFQYQSSCHFGCEEGFALVGTEEVQCMASGEWTAPAPVCKVVQCQLLEAPSKGTMDCVHPLATFAFGSSCKFECQPGYQMRGLDTLRCISPGHWTAPLPVCEDIVCDPLESPVHGSMDCSPSSRGFQYNTNCSFHCAEGFMLRGAKTAQCSDLGQWTMPAPICQALQCQDLPAPDKARMKCSHPFGAFNYQSACSFTCEEGFLLVGASILRCLATGNWSALPPECQAITCAPLLSPQNGTMTCVQPLGDSGYISTCQFICDEGFSLSGPESLDCIPSGHWTGSPPTCEAIRCPTLSAPKQGHLDCSGVHGEFSVGSTCRFSCNMGFTLNGSKVVECTASGRWTAPPPTCKGVKSAPTLEMRCPALITPEQGTMSCRHHLGTFGLNTTCYFGCKTGFTLTGDSSLRCGPSGQWTAVTPACRAVKCAELHVIMPIVMNCSNPWGNFSYGSTCTFHCPEDHILNGSARSACQENGHWSTIMPTCQGPLTVQEALTYFGGAVASTTGLVIGGTLLALLRKRFRQKDDGKSPLNPQSHLGTYGVFTNAAFDPTP